MKFALVDGEKVEAKPGLHGICAYCLSETVAHCGSVKIWHWKHKSKKKCDSWWENETAWHREWKNHFLKEWQEITHFDSEKSEKHIADIRTDKEFIIEFQHSPIKPEEMESRETFYKDMVWVVNGTRLLGDLKRFDKGLNDKMSGLSVKDFDSPIWKQ